jgi:hypothetical protein
MNFLTMRFKETVLKKELKERNIYICVCEYNPILQRKE